MKAKTFLFALVMLVGMAGLSSCRKSGCMSVNSCNYDADAKVDDGTCINKGQVTFWQDSTTNGYDIVVTVNATESNITVQHTPVPACDASGCANFSLCPGSHHWTAKENAPGTKTWSGDVLSIQDDCATVLLN
jgi:hypothetical protein